MAGKPRRSGVDLMYDVVIKGGKIVGSPFGTIKGDIGIAGECIAAIGYDLKGKDVVDASGKLVLPGAIDAHVHMELPVSGTRSSDDFASGTKAAACGGVTTVIDFTVGDRDSTLPEDIESRLDEAKKSYIDYTLHAEIIGWHRSRSWEILKATQMGVTSFKFFTAYSSSGRRTDRGALFDAFETIGDLGALAIVHAEDEEIINHIVSSLDRSEIGDMSTLAKARPPLCEALAVGDVIYLAERANARVHIVHLSSALGLEAFKRARSFYSNATAETCPQYLLLTKEVYEGVEGHLYSASPALRTSMDAQALWEGISSGDISLIATDHCPFTREQKSWKDSFLDLPYGLPGVETSLPLFFSEGVLKRGISLEVMVKLFAENPARIYGLFPRKGALQIGSDADITILDPNQEWTISSNNLHMNTDFSPYEGMTIKGKVCTTLSRGEVIYDNGLFKAREGRGKFLGRSI